MLSGALLFDTPDQRRDLSMKLIELRFAPIT